MAQIVVIGAGPAGLMAAIAAGKKGASVTALEYLPAPGRKLLATGAGKCNFTNMLSAKEMAERYAPEQRRFVRPALLGFPPEAVRKFFLDARVPYTLVDDFYCFPKSERADDILGALLNAARACGVRIVCNVAVEALETVSGTVRSVTAAGKEYPCDAVIAAAGGPGYPALGGRGSMDVVLAYAGIPVVPRVPALCGLKVAEPYWRNLAGIVLDDVTLTLDKKNVTRGTLLFTGEGISGPVALDISGRVARRILEGKTSLLPLEYCPEEYSSLDSPLPRGVRLALNFRPDAGPEFWHDLLARARREAGLKLVRNLFSHQLPQSVANAVCQAAGCSEMIAARLPHTSEASLVQMLTAGTLTVFATESWNKAMASGGGAARSEISPKTMQSRILRNLFFAGECMDVDAPCGGYNLTWAFSSGFLAGNEAVKACETPDLSV